MLCFLVHFFFCKEVNENEIEWKSRKWIKLKLPTSYQSSHQGCIDLQTNLSYSGISIKYKLYEVEIDLFRNSDDEIVEVFSFY